MGMFEMIKWLYAFGGEYEHKDRLNVWLNEKKIHDPKP